MIRLFTTCSLLLIIFCGKTQVNNLNTADSLFNVKQYFKASIVAEFILFDSDNIHERRRAIQIKIASLKKLAKFIELDKFIVSCYTQTMTEDLRYELLYEEILTKFILRDYKEVIQLSKFYPVDSLKKAILIDVLNIISLNELQQWAEANSLWNTFLTKNRLQDTLVNKLYTKVPQFKSEKRANTYSAIIPGLGQIYAGKPFEGVASFLFQSGSLFLGIKWWSLGYKIASISIGGSTFSAFYDGGKKRAKMLIKNYNSIKLFEYNNYLNKQILFICQGLI